MWSWNVGEQQHFFSGLHSLWQGNSIKAPCMLFQIIVSNLCWCCVFVLNQNVWDILKLSCPCKQVWLANTVIAIVVCGNWLNQYVLNYCCNSLWLPALMCFHFIADIFPKTSCPMLQCTRMHSEIWPAWLHCKMMENIGFDICSAESPATQLLIFAMHSNILLTCGSESWTFNRCTQ